MKLFDLEKNNRYLKNTYFRISLVCVVILAAIVLSLFMHWEPGGESWIYWFFTRIFLETGRFTLPDRSPLYTLYLSLFQWMGYPVSVIAEHIFTYFMVLGSLVLLFRRYLGLALSTFASLLWLPFLKVAEPSVQAIGLAFSCIAVYIRTSTSKKHKNYLKAASYTFFVLAYFLRGSYIVVLGVFILWDLYLILKKKDIKEIMQSFRPNINYLPFILLIALSILFMSVQSDHRFNNVWGFSSAWQPTDGKSLAETGFIGHYNRAYIEEAYGSYESYGGMDAYISNKEAFDGAETITEIVLANPGFIFRQLFRNIMESVILFAWLTLLVVPYSLGFSYLFVPTFIVSLIASLLIIFGALRASKNASMVLFVMSIVLQIGLIAVFSPKGRYMVPVIPVLVLAAIWLGKTMQKYLDLISAHLKQWPRINILGNNTKKITSLLRRLALPVALILLSNGIAMWGLVAIDVVHDISTNDLHVLERRPFSMKSSHDALESLIIDCNGIISLEHMFIGAFMDIPLSRIYDVYEIPPFGNIGNHSSQLSSQYSGLIPERIDCVLVSNELSTGTGIGTNYGLRYKNYILPYMEDLQDDGAKAYKIRDYGIAVIMPKSN
ncbi:MAG TPA: hypothetical protein VJC00_01760 [Candidatus Nanoarchaeia archaeon]|nr:hypothetical protein [Candidatus Nanoarchaeia archaeon]